MHQQQKHSNCCNNSKKFTSNSSYFGSKQAALRKSQLSPTTTKSSTPSQHRPSLHTIYLILLESLRLVYLCKISFKEIKEKVYCQFIISDAAKKPKSYFLSREKLLAGRKKLSKLTLSIRSYLTRKMLSMSENSAG